MNWWVNSVSIDFNVPFSHGFIIESVLFLLKLSKVWEKIIPSPEPFYLQNTFRCFPPCQFTMPKSKRYWPRHRQAWKETKSGVLSWWGSVQTFALQAGLYPKTIALTVCWFLSKWPSLSQKRKCIVEFFFHFSITLKQNQKCISNEIIYRRPFFMVLMNPYAGQQWRQRHANRLWTQWGKERVA